MGWGRSNFGLNLEEEDFTPYLEALKDHVQAHVLNAAGTGGTALVRLRWDALVAPLHPIPQAALGTA